MCGAVVLHACDTAPICNSYAIFARFLFSRPVNMKGRIHALAMFEPDAWDLANTSGVGYAQLL